jgi:hypothetical protein
MKAIRSSTDAAREAATATILREAAASVRAASQQLKLRSAQLRARSRAILQACAERRKNAGGR